MNLYIPDATQSLLDAAPQNGTRHEVMKSISFSLIGNQWPAEMVFTLLRTKFNTPDIPDKEIRDLVDGAAAKSPTPSGYGDKLPRPAPQPVPMAKRNPAPAAAKATDTLTNEERIARGIWWLSDNFTAADELPSISPVSIPTDPVEAAVLALGSLYTASECLNLVRTHFLDADGKAKPHGAGKTLSRDGWIEFFQQNGVPQSEAGCWFRFNPCKPGQGSGKAGAVTDADIVAPRFALIESDLLDMDTQASILCRLDLPVAAITASGDKSAHALVLLASKTDAEHAELSGALLDALFRIGFDRGNKNPSRLSRIPGATRQIKTTGDGIQRLLYLNPTAKPLDKDGLAALIARLDRQRFASKPMRKLIHSALSRYQDIADGVGIPAVKTGFDTFDRINGGLRHGLYYIVAAQTNVGKSSLALNITSNALRRGEGVAIFSLEMSQDDIVDMMFSNRAGVNRNVWNTGVFNQRDLENISTHTNALMESPLWIFDDPDQSILDIRETAEALTAQHPVKLIVVDYMQFVLPLPGKESREQQVSIISRGLKALAKKTGVAVLGISALNDDGKLRESRGAGYDADGVLQLEESGEDALIGRVTKGRFIAKKPYLFFFDKATMQMRDGGILAPEKQVKEAKSNKRSYHIA